MTPRPAITGFTTVFGITINPMVIVLALALAAVVVLVWRAQRDSADPFDVMDLVMDGGKASITKCAFLFSFGMSSWVVIDQEIKGSLSEAIFAAYLLAWVGPLVAKVIFNKTDMPKVDLGRGKDGDA